MCLGAAVLVCATSSLAAAQTCPTPTFGAGVPTPTTGEMIAGGMTVADFNGDGASDVAIAKTERSVVVILLSAAGGTLAAPAPALRITAPYAVAAADFDRDGRTDLVVAHIDATTRQAA